MKKLLLQFIVFIGMFFGLWFGLGQLPWAKWLKMDEFSKKRQKDISELLLRLHRLEKPELKNDSARAIIASIKNKLCLANNIDTASVRIYIFRDPIVNAFAIPGGHIIVNDAIVRYCDNPDMLAGIIAHEIGHIENGHISKRLAKEFVLSVVMMFGGDNFGMVKEIIRALSSGKFDRSQETEADVSAVRYLQKAHVNPHELGSFFSKMAETHGDMPDELEWISTHPNSKERAKKINKAQQQNGYVPVIDSVSWEYLVEACQ